MINTLFRQSDVAEPYTFYVGMLQNHPLYFDAENDLWAVYSYEYCHLLLNSASAAIPDVGGDYALSLNYHAQTVRSHLIRLNNPPIHPLRRAVIGQLFQSMQRVPIDTLLDQLIEEQKSRELEWIGAVCKKLPALAILRGFGFADHATNIILSRVEALTKVMAPISTMAVAAAVNRVADELYPLVETHLVQSGTLATLTATNSDHNLDEAALLALLTSNLLGFLIQSYDAGCGLLANGLLAHLSHGDRLGVSVFNKAYFDRLMLETLRFDPPVQNTRRILTQPVQLGEVELPAGSLVLIVVAAANRDPNWFVHPATFDIARPNNAEQLTFGAGAHTCLARYFVVDLVAETLTHLLQRYPRTKITNTSIAYQPAINVRLPKELRICLD